MAFLGRPKPAKPGPGQRSVWDFPRPPALEREPREIAIVFGGREIVRTVGALRVLETSHPPVVFVPPGDIAPGVLVKSERRPTACEWKGWARYFDVVVGERVAVAAAFCYDEPTRGFEPISGFLSFYAGPMERAGGGGTAGTGAVGGDGGDGGDRGDRGDGCFVDGERVVPQPGGFYSGWITRDVAGPFKGVAGSWGW